MKKIIFLLCVTLFFTHSINSQKKGGGREKIRALKVAYLTEQLNLTTSEAEQFWPIYNAQYKQQGNIRNNYKSILKKSIKDNGSIDDFNEEVAEKIISLKLETDKQLLELQEKFISSLKNVLSYKTIIKLQIAEMEFGRKLMRKYRHKKN